MLKKRAILFVNGDLRQKESALSLIEPSDFIVAVDGGLRHVQELNLRPHLLVGDFDSIDPGMVETLRSEGVEISKFPEKKNETDLELALEIVLEKGWTSICVMGALGKRLDQTFGNIFLLTQPTLMNCDIRLDDGVEEVFLIRSYSAVYGKKGDIVSLIPLSEKAVGVRTEGLEYPLKNETLFRYKTRGISNVLSGESGHVQVKEGVVLCVHTRTDEATYL